VWYNAKLKGLLDLSKSIRAVPRRRKRREVLRVIIISHGGSFTVEVRRLLFSISFNLYYYSLGTSIGGQFSYIY